MKLNENFNREYSKLNLQQKKAVDTTDGSVMVIAGPGTGKTQILTLRIANILTKTDTPPEAILALTFTEKAAHEMRKRLVELIGQTAYKLRISTFHAFANEIIRMEPDRFPRLIGGTNITEPDQLGLIETILEQSDSSLLRPFGRPEAYVKTVLGTIGDLKGRAVTQEQFKKLIAAEEKSLQSQEDLHDSDGKIRVKWRGTVRDIAKQRELLSAWQAYEEEFVRSNRYDFADMLVQVVMVLETDNDLRADLREKYLYFLIDEHQDTNRAQNRIVQLIAEPGDAQPNIFVVGDLEQAIYRFQGANPENFYNFTKQYPKATVIRLGENYRSTQTILDAALGISTGQGKLTARAAHTEIPVQLYAFSSPASQEWGVAHILQERIEKGTPLDKLAVLYRTNAEAAPILNELERAGIPAMVRGDQEVLGDLSIRKLLIVIQAASKMPQSRPLLEALHVDLLGLIPLDAHKIADSARRKKQNPWDIIRSKQHLAELGIENANKVHSVYQLLSELAHTMANTSAPYALETAVRLTSFVSVAAGLPDGDRVMAKLHKLFELVRSQMENTKGLKLNQFLELLERLERHNSELKAEFGGLGSAVQLMTAHSAKGLEFDTVIIINAAQGHWDGARKPPGIKLPKGLTALSKTVTDDLETDTEEDMRRLFYVSLTRARKEAIITWPQRKTDGKELLPSGFVLAIPEHLRTYADTSEYEAGYLAHRDERFSELVRKAPLAEKEYLNGLFYERGLTVTALNNYLECPWKYYFVNLIRIPEAPSLMGEYGSAAHEALRMFFDRVAAMKPVGLSYIISSFETKFRRAPLPDKDIEGMLKEGHQALSGWHAFWDGKWETNVRTEISVEGIMLGDIKLSGKLDKVEILDNAKNINVVDYKTTEPKSANELMGKTKNSSGNEFRQLVFYKLLLDREGIWHMKSGEIDFLEPNDSGKYKKEKFVIEPAQVQELEDKIKEASSEILELSFWSSTCGKPDCKYCKLRSMM